MLSDSLLMLGKIHWYLLHADIRMQNMKYREHEGAGFPTITQTAFGKDVQEDEINWWVFKQEHDIKTLKEKTQRALDAAQVLQKASKELTKYFYPSLRGLCGEYERFVRQYEREVKQILEYVQWLHERNELAPTILFNYRTWGSTRMADRSVRELGEISDPNTLEHLSFVVMGIIQIYGPKLSDVRLELESDKYEENIDFDDLPNSPYPYEFVSYFEKLRDSLRNVLLDIAQRETQDRLFTSDDFWRAFISKAARSVKTEQKYWDFKQTLSMWHTKREPAKSEKEHKFAEIVASFANKQGGVIIVGVTDSSPRQIVGLNGNQRDIENYMKYTQSVITQYIPYENDFVHLQQVNVPDYKGDYKLCLVIVVQQTYKDLRVIGLDGKSYTYPLRVETGLIRKEQYPSGHDKAGIKSDNYDFLRILQQFVNEDIS
jgi:hypothetical protein